MGCVRFETEIYLQKGPPTNPCVRNREVVHADSMFHALRLFLCFLGRLSAGADVDVHAAHGRKASRGRRGERPRHQGWNNVLQNERPRGNGVMSA